MILLLPLLLPALQNAEPAHASLHPGNAEVYAECADVPALLEAYPAAPMAGLMSDPESTAALTRLLGTGEFTGRDVLQWGIDALPLPGNVTEGALDLLTHVESVSVSARGGDDPGALVIVRLDDPGTAAFIATTLGSLGETDPDPAHAALPIAAGLSVTTELEGTPFHPLWFHRADRRIVVGMGSYDPSMFAGVASGDRTSALEAFDRHGAGLGPSAGATVVDGFHTRSPIDIAIDWADTLGLLEDFETELIADMASGLGEIVFGATPQRWRMQLRGDRFVTEIFEPGARSPMPALPWLGPAPLDPAALAPVHPGCFLVHAATFDPGLFLDDLLSSVAEGRPSSELRHELESAVGFPLARITDRLGPHVVTFVYPLQGIGLPKTFVSVELREGDDGEGLVEDLTEVAQVLAESNDGMRAKKSKYKKRPYLSVTLPEEVVSLGELGSVRPAIGLIDGRLVLTNSTLNLKREIRRELGEEDPFPPARYPWTQSPQILEGSASALYIDWAALIDGLFSMIRSFGGMISGFVEGMPFDLANPPDPRVFTRHMGPTLRTERIVDGGTLTRHEASFSFETWLGLVGLASHVIESLEGDAATTQPSVIATGPTPHQRTTDALRSVRSALVVYQIDQGAFPADLATLLQPTDSYPNGFVSSVPDDGWGRSLRYVREDAGRYRLWSVGPDGTDQNGQGDDVLP